MWGYTPVRITGVLVVKDVLSWRYHKIRFQRR